MFVSAGATRTQDLVLSSAPIQLATLDVKASDDCSLKGRAGQTLLQVWEQARSALAATALWEQSGDLDVHVVRLDGHIDASGYYSEHSYAVVDTARAREAMADRVFAATPPETIALKGFVRPGVDGRAEYEMPSAEVLLSDQFVDGHCFRLRSSDNHKDWIGVGFTPRRRVDGVADIRGVLWLERATAELRHLEFEYVNYPAEYRVCDMAPLIKLTPDRVAEVPPFQQPKPACATFKNDRSNRLGLGGTATFSRLPTGEWLIASWTMRAPPDEGKYRPLPWKVRQVRRQTERCYFGPDCHTIVTMRPRLVTIEGSIARVRRGGVDLFRSDSALALIAVMAAKRAGDSPATLAGRVTNSEGEPLGGVVVQTHDPSRVALTDTAGMFTLSVLPAGRMSVTVRCRGYQPVRLNVPLRSDSTHRVTVLLAMDSSAPRAGNCAVSRTAVGWRPT